MSFKKTGVAPIEEVLCPCGAKLSKGAKVCAKCGKAVTAEEKQKQEDAAK